VTIETEDLALSVSLDRQTVTITNGSGRREEAYPVPLQSEVTAAHVAAILSGAEPELPDYATAAKLHRVMLAAFLDHLRRSTGDASIDECPIT
jgi:hypothetical protein